MRTEDLLWRDHEERGHMPRYLSPTAFMLFESDPIAYYWKYLAPKEFRPEQGQYNYMAAGSIVDALVKLELDPDCGASIEKKVDPLVLADGITMRRSRAIFEEYKRTPAWTSFPEGLRPEPTGDKVITREIGPDHFSITLAGIPDADFPGGVLDWKVLGSFAKNGGKLPKGFKYLWTEAGDVNRKMHPKRDDPIEAIDEKWATQLTFYAWIAGSVPCPGYPDDEGRAFAPIRGIIEALVCPPWDEELFEANDMPPLTVARVDSMISASFQEQLWERLCFAWSAIRDKQVIPESELEAYPDFATFRVLTAM